MTIEPMPPWQFEALDADPPTRSLGVSFLRHRMSVYAVDDRPAAAYRRGMNQLHLDLLSTDEWRQTLEELALPFALERSARPTSATTCSRSVLGQG